MQISSDLMALAIVPGLLLIIYVYRKDRVEKEPPMLMIKLVLFGVISCIAAGYIEQFESQFLPAYPEGSLEYALQTSFLMAALVEETVKFLAMRLASWNNKAFNYRFDGVVYGLTAAVGFAIYENIMYVAMFGMQTAIVRAFTAIPLHAFCGAFMGAIYSYSKKASIMGNKGKSVLYTIFALLVPMMIHGTYDTFAFLGQDGTVPLLILVVILYVAAITMIRKLSASDYRAGFYPEARPIDYEIKL